MDRVWRKKLRNMHSQKDLLEIESQLSFPNGENGIRIAKMMNDTNIIMTLEGIKSLKLKAKDIILEIGQGNGDHVSTFFESHKNINYYGLEISETMKTEAELLNERYIKDKQASFYLYDGRNIPFQSNSFAKIFTVNTLYFWEFPELFIREIARVLKPNGIFSVVFSKKEFLENLPFVQSKFKLYSNDDMVKLAEGSDLILKNIGDFSDHVKSKSGEQVLRKFSVVSFTR